MLGPKAWSWDLAARDALVAFGLPKAERRQEQRRDTTRGLHPETLRSAWEEVTVRLLPSWRARAEQVYVVAPPADTDGCSPVALATSRMSRRIEVPRGYLWLLCGLGEAHIVVFEAFALWQAEQGDLPDEDATLDEMWRWFLDSAEKFVAALEPSPNVRVVVGWVAHLIENPRSAWESRQVDGHIAVSRPVVGLADGGLQFALAHEVGHHLLNHLEPQVDVAALDVQGAVQSWLTELDVAGPLRLNRHEKREWYADAFAAMVLTRPADPDAAASPAAGSFERLARTASGAALGLLALFLSDRPSVLAPSSARRTHPSVETRLEMLMTTFTLAGRDVQEPWLMVDGKRALVDVALPVLQVFATTVIVLQLLGSRAA